MPQLAQRLGRRPLLLAATAGMGACLVAFAVMMHLLPGRPLLLLVPVLYLLIFLRGFYPVREPKKIDFKKWIICLIICLPFLLFAMSYKKSFRLIMPALAVYVISYLFYRKRSLSPSTLHGEGQNETP